MTQIHTVYEVYEDGRIVDVTSNPDVAERHSVERDRTVFAETTEVPMA